MPTGWTALWDPSKGLLFDKTKPLLDPYAKAITGQSVWGGSAVMKISTMPELSEITLTGRMCSLPGFP